MNKHLPVLIVLLGFGLVGCATSGYESYRDNSVDAWNEIMDTGYASQQKNQRLKQNVSQIHSAELKNYPNIQNQAKALVKTSTPICLPQKESKNCIGSSEKYYAGSQANIIYSIIEAFYFCNNDHHASKCELVRVGDYDALESEKEFWNQLSPYLLEYFQITVLRPITCIDALKKNLNSLKLDESYWKCPNRSREVIQIAIRRNDKEFEIEPPESVKRYL